MRNRDEGGDIGQENYAKMGDGEVVVSYSLSNTDEGGDVGQENWAKWRCWSVRRIGPSGDVAFGFMKKQE